VLETGRVEYVQRDVEGEKEGERLAEGERRGERAAAEDERDSGGDRHGRAPAAIGGAT